MKSTLTIAFLVPLVGFTLVNGGFFCVSPTKTGAYKKLLKRLETRIRSSPDIWTFEFKEDLVQRLKTWPSEYKDIYMEFGKSEDVNPVNALTETIDTIFQQYKERAEDFLQYLDDIRRVDPLGFILYFSDKDKRKKVDKFEDAILLFHPTMMDRRNLRNSKTDLSFIQPFETNQDGLQSIPPNVLAEVTTERTCLLDESLNFFRNIVNAHFQDEKMYNVIFYEAIDNYNTYKSINVDDVQILYGGDVGPYAIGHWICTHYKGSDHKVYVYDSAHKNYLNSVQEKIIEKLYPDKKRIIYVKPKITQNDCTSCGLFAIFYATTIILGHKPNDVNIKINDVYGDPSLYMRLHVLKMFANGKLAPFPL